MSYPYSNPGAGARISATVKWYNPAKAYGFLVPEVGSPDIYCRDTALAAVGLDTLLSGATVQCETVQGRRGPEVARILAVDFSTASPQAASFAPVASNGRMAAGPGIGQAGPAETAPGRRITALVKWFMPAKGYGFLEPEDGSQDVFCHISAVEASGRDTLPQGGVVTCEIAFGDRGPQVSRILSVDPPAAGHGPAERSQPFDGGYRRPAPSCARFSPADRVSRALPAGRDLRPGVRSRCSRTPGDRAGCTWPIGGRARPPRVNPRFPRPIELDSGRIACLLIQRACGGSFRHRDPVSRWVRRSRSPSS